MIAIVARIDVANAVLAKFTSLTLLRKPGGIYVNWKLGGVEYTRRWQCRGQDFYPVWSRKFPHGGTCSAATAQLIRWIQGKPVLSIATWRYWASETCKLLEQSVVDELEAEGYPTDAICVLCKQTIRGGLDWWSLGKLSGPCCSWRSGCRQQITSHHVDSEQP